jgi:hypothetical protein
VTTTTTTREVTITGPVAREVLVTRAPPEVRVEAETVSPGPGYVWTRGYWRWNGADYVWVPGGWVERPRPAAVWVAGHWVRRPGGWIWIYGSPVTGGKLKWLVMGNRRPVISKIHRSPISPSVRYLLITRHHSLF